MQLKSEVNGVVVPALIGGHPALDLCNTYAGWADPPGSPGRGDYLVDYDALAEWAGAAGLIASTDVAALRREALRHPRLAPRVLVRVIALREALHVVTEPEDARGRSAALGRVDAAAHAATARATLVPGEGWRPARGLEQVLDACAFAAVALLRDVPLEEVRACPGDGCGWLFHDPAGRRRWCRMEWCGNRFKQRAHAARTRQSRSARS